LIYQHIITVQEEDFMNQINKKTVFHVGARLEIGSIAVKTLPKHKVAGNIYGVEKQSTPVVLDRSGFTKLYEAEGDTGLVYLEIDENKTHVPVLIDDVQVDSVTGVLQHVVFRRVNLKEKLSATVPIELIGENTIPETTVVQVLSELDVEALPTDFPDSFEVDISLLKEVGDSITIADLQYDKSKVTIEFSGDTDETAPVVLLQEVKEEVEEEVEEVAATDEVAPVETTEQSNPAEEAE
jgi:large subunit ribosomal protein L25